MPKRRILFCSVVRFNPSRSAAPFFTAIRPDAPLKASTITLHSACRKLEVDAATKIISEEVRSSDIDTSNSSPRVRMTARSMKFANSLTFPFQGQLVNVSIACLGTDLICFRIRAENFETKKLTSNGISSRRSRSGGISIGKTLNR